MARNSKAVRHFAKTTGAARKEEKEAAVGAGAVNKVSKARSFGVGESQNFGGTDPKYRADLDWDKLTVGGKPINDFLRGRLLYSQTDQGAAELATKDPLPRTQILRDRTTSGEIEDADRDIERFADNLVDDEEFHMARDPFEVPLRLHTPAGRHGCFLSERKCAREGMVRNGVTYQPVLVPNKDTGAMERVSVGGMFLASCSDSAWQRSQQYFMGLGKEKMDAATNRVREQSDRVMGQSDMRDMMRRRARTDNDGIDGVALDDPDTAADDLGMVEHEMG